MYNLRIHSAIKNQDPVSDEICLTFYEAVLRIASPSCESEYLFSVWCGSGAGFDWSVWCGSQSGSCSSSKWWESPTTGLQILYGFILSLSASILSVHDPSRLHFEPPQLLSCQLCLGSQPGRTPTLPPVCGSNEPPLRYPSLAWGGGGGAVMYPPTHVVMLKPYIQCLVMWTAQQPPRVSACLWLPTLFYAMFSPFLYMSTWCLLYWSGQYMSTPIIYLLNTVHQCCGTVTIFCGSGSNFWKVTVPGPVPTFDMLQFRFRLLFWFRMKIIKSTVKKKIWKKSCLFTF